MSNQRANTLKQFSDQTWHEEYTNELASRAVEGDKAALQELLANPDFIRKVRTISISVLRGLRGSYEDPGDFQQDLILRVCNRITTLRDVGSLNNWLYRVAMNLLIDRGRERRWNTFESIDVKEDPVISASQFAEVALREAINQLTLTQRLTLRMKLEGASSKEIAQELRISEAQAHRTLKKAQEIIAARMEHPIQTEDWGPLIEMLDESLDLEIIFDESLVEISEIRSRMKQTQLEIDRQRETTRSMIAELGF